MALDPADLRKMLAVRIVELGRRRQETLQQRANEALRLQAQMDACQQLADGWDTMPVQQALVLIAATGIDLKIN
jgi:hypothetical protein